MKIQIFERMRNTPTVLWSLFELIISGLLFLGMGAGILMTLILALVLDQLLLATLTTFLWMCCAAALAYVFMGEAHRAKF